MTPFAWTAVTVGASLVVPAVLVRTVSRPRVWGTVPAGRIRVGAVFRAHDVPGDRFARTAPPPIIVTAFACFLFGQLVVPAALAAAGSLFGVVYSLTTGGEWSGVAAIIAALGVVAMAPIVVAAVSSLRVGWALLHRAPDAEARVRSFMVAGTIAALVVGLPVLAAINGHVGVIFQRTAVGAAGILLALMAAVVLSRKSADVLARLDAEDSAARAG